MLSLLFLFIYFAVCIFKHNRTHDVPTKEEVEEEQRNAYTISCSNLLFVFYVYFHFFAIYFTELGCLHFSINISYSKRKKRLSDKRKSEMKQCHKWGVAQQRISAHTHAHTPTENIRIHKHLQFKEMCKMRCWKEVNERAKDVATHIVSIWRDEPRHLHLVHGMWNAF